MKFSQEPRLVVVTRRTAYEQLLARHGTKGQASFFLKSRAQSIDRFEAGHSSQQDGAAAVLAQIPPDRRRARVDRAELDRFVFEPDDIVIVVGQDGLVANVAKYLDGQPVVGVNPDPRRYDGVLCTVPPGLAWAAIGSLDRPTPGFHVEQRPLVEVSREDGQHLLALNEVFAGHASHQSALYSLSCPEGRERHSSSGVIVATGTGATGWARSIARQRGLDGQLPGPLDRRLAWFAREPFPTVTTGTRHDFGLLGEGDTLELLSEMGEGGTLFGDGIEADRLEFNSGQIARIRLADRALRLVRRGAAPMR